MEILDARGLECPLPVVKTKELLKEIGVEGEWEGIGHCAVGYVDGEFPKPAKRKDNRVFWVD